MAIIRLIAELEQATLSVATSDQRLTLADWLYETPYTLDQITAAAETVALMETYGRPLARRFWFQAFGEPVITPRQLAAIKQRAFEAGYRKRREEEEREGSPEEAAERMNATTVRLLACERERWKLKEDLDRAGETITQLRKERRAYWRREADCSTAETHAKNAKSKGAKGDS